MPTIAMRDTLFQFLRFGGVGVLATLVHAMTYVVLSTAIPAQAANFAGYVLAVGISYVGHLRFTFGQQQDRSDLLRILRFVAASLCGFVLNAAFVYLVTDLLNQDAWKGVFFILLVTPAMTFILLKFWVFR